MKPSVYVETTILSYLTGLPSKDVVVLGRQQSTMAWWRTRDRFACCVSELVLNEAARGDVEAASRRLAAADGLRLIPILGEARPIAAQILLEGAMPAKAAADALHVAIAAIDHIDYLVTWNCTHIANAVMRPKIEAVCARAGLRPPIICTPDELMPLEDD